MASASEEFAEAVAVALMHAPQIPVIGNVSARPLNTVPEIQEELAAQLTAPVRWTESMTYLVGEGIDAVTRRISQQDTRTGTAISSQARLYQYDNLVELCEQALQHPFDQ